MAGTANPLCDEGGVMAGLLNFVSVCNVLVEPDAKLIVRGDPGYADRSACIRIEFDPEIGLDNLTMERSEDDKQRWERINTRPAPPLLFRSEKAEKLTDIMIDPVFENGIVRLVIRRGEHGLEYKANLIGRSNVDRWMGKAYQLLNEIFTASIKLPIWDELAKQYSENNSGRIGLWLDRSLAEQLALHSNFRFDPSAVGDILVAEREVWS